MRLARQDLIDLLAVALEDIPMKEVGSNCLSTAIYAALELGFSKERFLSVVDRSFDSITAAGGLDADAEAILAQGPSEKRN